MPLPLRVQELKASPPGPLFLSLHKELLDEVTVIPTMCYIAYLPASPVYHLQSKHGPNKGNSKSYL